MLPKAVLLSLIPSLCLKAVGGIVLDVNSADSIKSTAQKLAAGIITNYNQNFSASAVGVFNQPYYFWEAGAVWDGLVEYSYLTGDAQWNKLVGDALQAQVGPYHDYMPPNQTITLGNSDQSQWALAVLTAAELSFPAPSGYTWANLSAAVFDTQAARWDDQTCNGGLRWQIFQFNSGYTYKNTETAGNFFLLATRLARFTGNKTYSDWAEKQLSWVQQVGLVTEQYQVFDGTDVTQNCSSSSKLQWTKSLGAFIEGSAVMYNITSGDKSWKGHLDGFLNTSSLFLNPGSKIISERACETNGKCDVDQRAYKGVYARSLGRAMVFAPYTESSIQPVLQASAVGAAKGCETSNDAASCYLKWFEQKGLQGGLGETLNALEVTQALLYPVTGKQVATANSTSPSATTSSSSLGTSGSAQATSSASAGGHSTVAWSITGLAGLVSMSILGL